MMGRFVAGRMKVVILGIPERMYYRIGNWTCKTFSRSFDYRLFESKIVACQPFFKTPTAQKPMPSAPKYGVIGPLDPRGNSRTLPNRPSTPAQGQVTCPVSNLS